MFLRSGKDRGGVEACLLSNFLLLSTPSFDRASTPSFLVMVVCEWTLWMDIWGWVQCNWCTITTMSSLFGWWCCEDGCLMWLLIGNIFLILSVNI